MAAQAETLYRTRVADAWVDYNGHMNDAEYARVFSLAVEALMDRIGLDAAGRPATPTRSTPSRPTSATAATCTGASRCGWR